MTKPGAASYSVGMPSFAALYALNAALRYVDAVGVATISAHADPLVRELHAGLVALGLKPMSPLHADRPTGIIAFMHERSAEIHSALEAPPPYGSTPYTSTPSDTFVSSSERTHVCRGTNCP